MTLESSDPSSPLTLRLAPGQRWLVHLPQDTWVACRSGHARLRQAASAVPEATDRMPGHDLPCGQGLALQHASWISLDAVTACTLEIRTLHEQVRRPGSRRAREPAHRAGIVHALLSRLGLLRWVVAR